MMKKPKDFPSNFAQFPFRTRMDKTKSMQHPSKAMPLGFAENDPRQGVSNLSFAAQDPRFPSGAGQKMGEFDASDLLKTPTRDVHAANNPDTSTSASVRKPNSKSKLSRDVEDLGEAAWRNGVEPK